LKYGLYRKGCADKIGTVFFVKKKPFPEKGTVLLCLIWLIPGPDTGNQGGDSASCGTRPACAAGSRRATGTDPFVACGRDGCGGLGKKNQFTWEHASGELTFMR